MQIVHMKIDEEFYLKGKVNFMNQTSMTLKQKLYKIIFEADSPKGKAFDVVLIIFIIFSCLVVLLDSIESINVAYNSLFSTLEWIFVIAFTIEYLLRIYCVDNKIAYMKSFFGVIDLLSILPGFVIFLFPSAKFLLVIRVLRLLRLFRIFKMARYVRESNVLMKALAASRPKITVFIFTMLSIVTVVGALMYLVEGPENGYDNIPQSMYWAITTVTTVGYGDISPGTPTGKFIASVLMFLAYGVLAVPTGIITYELAQVGKPPALIKKCPSCNADGHNPDSDFCHKCGERLEE